MNNRLYFRQNFTLSALLISSFLTAQTTYFVKPNGTGNGTSWAQASGNLRLILTFAAKNSQVWVATGTYTPTTCSTCTDADRRLAFVLPDSVAVYGGFVGNESNLNQRNIQNTPSVLSGNIGNQSLQTDNSFNVLYAQNVGNQSIIDGFTIRDGYANDNLAVGEITTSGAGFFIDGRVDGKASPTVRNCIFRDNFANGFGGAVMNAGSFRGKSESIFTNCLFENNRSEQAGGAVHNLGIFGGNSSPSFLFCQFKNNRTNQSGGAVFCDAVQGRCEAVFKSCRFESNIADFYGAAFYNNGKTGVCNPTIENCLFSNNQAFSAGAVYCLGSERGDCSPKIYNSIFYRNTATTGGAIYANAGDTTGKSQPRITNCIIWGNTATTAPFIRAVYGTPILSYSIINADNCDSVYLGNVQGHGACTEGVIYNQNPLFVDPQNGDFRLLPQSPAVDAGLDSIVLATIDLDSKPRKRFVRVDIGAIEFDNTGFFAPKTEESPANRTVCARDVVVIRAKFSGTNPLFYQWYQNDQILTGQTTDSLKFLNIAETDAGIFRCTVRNNQNQTAQSANMTLTVKPQLPLSISVAVDTPAICEGDSITMRARSTNGGIRPRYDWRINDASLGLSDTVTVVKIGYNSPFFRLKCIVRSSEQCAIPNPAESNIIQYNVLPRSSDTAAVTLLSPLTTDYCEGDSVVFSAMTRNAGATPQYQWFVNNTLKINNLQQVKLAIKNGDVVKVKLISSIPCLAKSQAESSLTISRMLPIFNFAATLTANKNIKLLCPNGAVEFRVTPQNFFNPPQYDWSKNGIRLNISQAIYTTNNLVTRDIISVKVTSSDFCGRPKDIILRSDTANVCNATIDFLSEKIQLFPNPSSQPNFTLTGLENFDKDLTVSVLTILGQTVFSQKINPKNSFVALKMDKILRGVFWVKISDGEQIVYKKWVLQ